MQSGLHVEGLSDSSVRDFLQDQEDIIRARRDGIKVFFKARVTDSPEWHEFKSLVFNFEVYEYRIDEGQYRGTPVQEAGQSSFTYDEVKKILCPACALNIPDFSTMTTIENEITHSLNGVRIPCKAQAWRTNPAAFGKTEGIEATGKETSCEH